MLFIFIFSVKNVCFGRTAQHVGSQFPDQGSNSALEAQSLIHCTVREVLAKCILNQWKHFKIRYMWEGCWVTLEIWLELFFFMEIKWCHNKGGMGVISFPPLWGKVIHEVGCFSWCLSRLTTQPTTANTIVTVFTAYN